MAGPADQFGVRNSELNEKCSGHAVGAPSASLRPCGRPRGTVLVCRVLWRMRGERIFFLFACPKRKNQRETILGRGRLRFLPLPRPTLMETPKRGAPPLGTPLGGTHSPGASVSPSCLPLRGRCREATKGVLLAGRGQAPPLHGDRMVPVLRRGDSRIARRSRSCRRDPRPGHCGQKTGAVRTNVPPRSFPEHCA